MSTKNNKIEQLSLTFNTKARLFFIISIVLFTLTASCQGTTIIDSHNSTMGCGVPLYKSSGKRWSKYPVIKAGSVCTAIHDGQGGFFIGGSFTEVGSIPRNNIAHVLPDGTVDPYWNPNADGTVRAIVKVGQKFYVGGSFNRIGGKVRNFIACLDSSGRATPWNPNANLPVTAISVWDSNIYVGGFFSAIGGKQRNYLACLDNTGRVTPWNPNPNWFVTSLAIAPPYIYVAGKFTRIGGQQRNYLACLDTSGLLTSWNPNPNDDVGFITISDGKIFVCDSFFDTIAGQHRRGIACLDTSGNTTTWNPEVDDYGIIRSVAIDEQNVYIAGSFTKIDGKPRKNVACIDHSGNVTSWNPKISNDAYSIALSNSAVYVGLWCDYEENRNSSEKKAEKFLDKATDKKLPLDKRLEYCNKAIKLCKSLTSSTLEWSYAVRISIYELSGDRENANGNAKKSKLFYEKGIADCKKVIELKGGKDTVWSRDDIAYMAILLAKCCRYKEAANYILFLSRKLVTDEERQALSRITSFIEHIKRGKNVHYSGNDQIVIKKPPVE